MSDTDRAFLNTAFVFGDAIEPNLSVFNQPLRSRLEQASRHHRVPSDRANALSQLKALHDAQIRADPAQIHPSWVSRALLEESRPVQVAVLSRLPESIRHDVAVELAIARDEVDRVANTDSIYRAIARSLALSRLVGDQPIHDEDPPVIRALVALEPSAAPKMIRRMGVVKWSTTPVPLLPADRNDHDRWQTWVESLGTWDDRFLNACQAELSHMKTLDARAINRLGLTTFSRLLTPVEPYRLRWTLQQLPYNTAKTIRSRMGTSEPDFPAILAEEARLFQATWIALWNEGAIKQPWPSERSA